MRRTKPIFSILLTGILVLPLISILTITAVQRHMIGKEIKRRIIEGIDKKELVLLKFETARVDEEVEWEHSREFEYRGSMYDIVETKIEGDQTYYWCWWDNEETELNKKRTALLNNFLNGDSKKQNQKSLVISFFKNLYQEGISQFEVIRQSEKLKFRPYLISFTSPQAGSDTPPPKQS